MMKPHLYPMVLCCLLATTAFGQNRTITAAGSWANSGIWSGGAIADVVGENASINSNLGVITVGADFTVGDVAMNNGNTLTISNGFTLNIGDAVNSRDLSSGNSPVVNVNGTLIIWGDVNVNNNLDLNVPAGGTLIIKGNVNMNNGGDLVISGNVQIDGNLTGGNDTDLVVNGTVTIGGNLSVGNNSDPSGTGTVSVGGTCSDGGSNFCGVGPLPIELIFFKGVASLDGVELSWATAMELNFDYFILQRSVNGRDFIDLDSIKGSGDSRERRDYSFLDTDAHPGHNYYRLREVDIDSFTKTFDVIQVLYTGPLKVSVYPNPVTAGAVNIQYNFETATGVEVTITDMFGSKVLEARSSEGNFTIPVSLSTGQYLLHFVAGQHKEVRRLFIR